MCKVGQHLRGPALNPPPLSYTGILPGKNKPLQTRGKREVGLRRLSVDRASMPCDEDAKKLCQNHTDTHTHTHTRTNTHTHTHTHTTPQSHEPQHRITCTSLAQARKETQRHLLLDVFFFYV